MHSILKVTMFFFLVSLMPMLVSTRGTSSVFSSPNMDKNCGNTISLNGDNLPGTYFSLTSSRNYAQNLKCILTIKAATASQRIIVVVEKMDIVCGGDQLLIYDGKQDPTALLNRDASSQCGTKKFYNRTVNANTAIIEFDSNNDGKVGSGFMINAAINFPVSSCQKIDNLYRCLNGYCISRSFDCDDRNWCGDDTQTKVC